MPEDGEHESVRLQRELFDQLERTGWVPLAAAEAATGASRSTLRSWYRSGEIPSRLVDSPHGPQRIVPLEAVAERAERSQRIQRRTDRALGVESQVEVLRHRIDQLEQRLARLERGLPSRAG